MTPADAGVADPAGGGPGHPRSEEAGGGRRRYAVALVVAGRLGAEIDGLRRALGADSVLRIPPHVTLVPPVNVPAAEVAAVLEVVRGAAAVASPITVELGGPATFHPVTPVVYLSVGGDVPGVAQLRSRLALGPLAPPLQREEHPFVPHVTLDQNIDPERLPAALEALADFRQPYTFETVTVFEQDTTPERVWHAVAAYRLAAPAVVGRGGVELTLASAPGLDPVEARWTSEAIGENPRRPFAVTARRAGGTLAGTATGFCAGGVCELGSVVVDPASRRQGVGSQLLRAVEDLAASAGCKLVRAQVSEGTEVALLLAGRGYQVLARLPSPAGVGADQLVVQRPSTES